MITVTADTENLKIDANAGYVFQFGLLSEVSGRKSVDSFFLKSPQLAKNDLNADFIEIINL